MPNVTAVSPGHVYIETPVHITKHTTTRPMVTVHDSITKQLQMRLQKLGYYWGTIDGVNGPQTKAAVKKFQYDNFLKQTGNVDKYTGNELKLNE